MTVASIDQAAKTVRARVDDRGHCGPLTRCEFGRLSGAIIWAVCRRPCRHWLVGDLVLLETFWNGTWKRLPAWGWSSKYNAPVRHMYVEFNKTYRDGQSGCHDSNDRSSFAVLTRAGSAEVLCLTSVDPVCAGLADVVRAAGRELTSELDRTRGRLG